MGGWHWGAIIGGLIVGMIIGRMYGSSVPGLSSLSSG